MYAVKQLSYNVYVKWYRQCICANLEGGKMGPHLLGKIIFLKYTL